MSDSIPTAILTCSICGELVRADKDHLVRSCEHAGARVIAHLKAECHGEGGVQPPASRAV